MSVQKKIEFGAGIRRMMKEEGVPAQAIVQELSTHPRLGPGIQALMQAGDSPDNIVKFLTRHYDTDQAERARLAEGLKKDYQFDGDEVKDLDTFLEQAGQSGMGILAGSGKWFTDKALGAKQLFTTDDEKDKALQAQVAEKRALDKPLSETVSGKVGEFLPELLVGAAVPGSTAAGLGTRVGVSAAANAGLGAGLAAFDPTAEGESTLKNMAWAGGLGAAGGATGELLTTGAGKFTKPELKELDEFLKGKGVNLTGSELAGDPETPLSRMMSFATGSGEISARRQNRAAAIRALKEIQEKSASEGVDSGQFYDEFRNMTEGMTMPAEGTATQAKEFLRQYPEDFRNVLADADMRRALKLEDALTVPSKKAPAGPSLVDEFGQPLRSAPQATDEVSEETLKEVSPYAMFELKKDVGERTRKAGSTASKGKAKALYGAIREDLEKWGASSPEAGDALATLNKADFKHANKIRAKMLEDALQNKSIRTASTKLRREMSKGGAKLPQDANIQKLATAMRNMDLENTDEILKRVAAAVILSGGGAYASQDNPVMGAIAPLLALRYANSLRRTGAGAGTKSLAALLRAGSRSQYPDQEE